MYSTLTPLSADFDSNSVIVGEVYQRRTWQTATSLATRLEQSP
jgi:hypothetical protein